MNRDELLNQYMDINQRLIRLWKSRFFEAADAEGLSPALMGILSLLSHMQPITSSEIAKEMHVTRGAVAQFIESLTELGYVTRQHDPEDRRLQYLSLSNKGTEAVKRLEQVRKKLFEDLTCNLSDQELRQAIIIDNKIINTLE
jgi:DNA-binding MarR family transcriptional regulator